MTTITTNKKSISIKIQKEKLIGFAIGYKKQDKTLFLILPFLVIEIKTKLLTDSIKN